MWEILYEIGGITMSKKATMLLVKNQLPGPYVNIAYRVKWLLEDGSVRKPEETVREISYPGMFTAAGKAYSSWEQLCNSREDEYGHLCRDIYGREVFAEWERFPCFDSYDYLYENRYYRWFFIREGDRLVCVHYTDGQDQVSITDDVYKLTQRCWKAMTEYQWQG